MHSFVCVSVAEKDEALLIGRRGMSSANGVVHNPCLRVGGGIHRRHFVKIYIFGRMGLNEVIGSDLSHFLLLNIRMAIQRDHGPVGRRISIRRSTRRSSCRHGRRHESA